MGRVTLEFWDTFGQDEFDRLRQLVYPETDVIVICYSVDSAESFDRVTTKWVPEVRVNSLNTHIVLVGCKVDLRPERAPANEFVSSEEGRQLARDIRAKRFYECSSLTGVGVDLLFQDVAEIAAQPRPAVASNCVIA